VLPSIIHYFVTEDERQGLREWAMHHFNSGNLTPNRLGNHRFYGKFADLHTIALHDVLRERIQALYPAGSLIPNGTDYVSCIEPGGFVHEHIDTLKDGDQFNFLRANVFVQLPDYGGMPVVEGKAYTIGNGDLLMFTANEHKHKSEMVGGKNLRIICSFGFKRPK